MSLSELPPSDLVLELTILLFFFFFFILLRKFDVKFGDNEENKNITGINAILVPLIYSSYK